MPERGRDCCFSGGLCGLGAWDGTRLWFFRGFARSRCFRWDEAAVFPGFEQSRCRRRDETAVFLGFEQSRCLRRDETAVFLGFCAVSVLGMGRDCCFSGVLCSLGVGEGTRLLFFLWFCAVSVSERGRDYRCRFKCVPHLVGGSLIVRLSAKTASQSCCCLRGIGSG